MTPTQTTYELVMWDFGGVFTGSPFHATGDYAAELGTTRQELADVVLGYGMPDGDHPWHRLERGELSMVDAVGLVAEQATSAGLEGFDLGAFFTSMGDLDAVDRRESMLAVVARISAAGVRNVMVTNNIAEMADSWRRLIPDGLFDDVIDSSTVGVRKPDPAIYELALSAGAVVAPERAVFLDDHLANVEAARALGITGILVGADPLDAAHELLALLQI